MNEFLVSRRKDDAIISVCQDNEQRAILISALSKSAENLLQYKEEDLLNKPLTDILSAKASDIINDELDYAEDERDLCDILPKIMNLSLVDSKGENIQSKVKVFRTTQFTRDKINYELLIRDISLFHKLRIFRDNYLAGKKYENHSVFGVLNNDSTMLELSIILNFAFQHQTNIPIHNEKFARETQTSTAECLNLPEGNKIAKKIKVHKKHDIAVGIISLDNRSFLQSPDSKKFSESGIPNEIENTLKVTIEHFYKNSRSDDFIGYIDHNKLLFIIIGCSANNLPRVVGRIHAAINEQLSQKKLPGISITHKNISSQVNSVELVDELLSKING